MGLNIAEKIIAAHADVPLSSQNKEAGAEVGIRIDQVLLQDTTGPMALLQFQAIDVPRIAVQRALTFIDHQTLQEGFENADDHAYIQSISNRYGAIFSRAGNGICHQITLERFSRPGWAMIGTDSHTPTCGAVGMLSIGAGGLDAAVVMAGGLFYMPYPKVMRINLHGKLRPWSGAKDIILEILRLLTVKGNVGVIIEYGGEGVASLSVPERATIANMGTELGVTTSLFPSDNVVRGFFRAQKRENEWSELLPDPDAVYDRTLDLDLASVRPSVARPHSPGNVTSLKELAAEQTVKVNQVLVGSCTNSSYKDLMTVATLLKGRRIAGHLGMGIAPGSRQVLKMLADNGALSDIISSGARILESACGFCVGCGQSPRSKGVSVRTSNRNFKGRSGTEDAQVYLTGPEAAVVAALTGVISDPSEAGLPWSEVSEPDEYYVDDSVFQYPTYEGDILRGPNIGDPPRGAEPEAEIHGVVALALGDDVSTDDILPAGPLLKYRSNVAKYSEYVFHSVDPDFASRCKDLRSAKRGAIIVGGAGYGQGSSREHAAICPMHLGVRAVITKNMERIHRANLVNFGILPLFFADAADHARIAQGDELHIPDVEGLIATGAGAVRNSTKDFDFRVIMPLSGRQKDILRHGGLLRHVRQTVLKDKDA